MYTKSIVRYEIKPNTFLSIPVRSNIKTGRGNFSQIRLKSSLVKHEEIRSIEAYLDGKKEARRTEDALGHRLSQCRDATSE